MRTTILETNRPLVERTTLSKKRITSSRLRKVHLSIEVNLATGTTNTHYSKERQWNHSVYSLFTVYAIPSRDRPKCNMNIIAAR